MNHIPLLDNLSGSASNFSYLMENWMDVMNNAAFKVADATKSDSSRNSFSANGSSSLKSSGNGKRETLSRPSDSYSSTTEDTLSLSTDDLDKTSSSSPRKSGNNNNKRSSKSNKGVKKGNKNSSNIKKKGLNKSSNNNNNNKNNNVRTLLPTFEIIGNESNDLTMELQHGVEGFDMHISQNVCDDSKPVAGKEAESYFLMRHSFQYPGPWMTMMQGPSAATNGGGGIYRVSAEAVHKNKYVLVGTYNNNTVEGVWEHTWNKNIKSQLTFIAGFLTQQQRQMQMMMGGQGPKFPSIVGYTDFRFQNWASKLRIDMMNNEMSFSLNRKILNNLMIGSRIATTYDQRKTMMEFGARYTWYSSNNNIGLSSDDDSNSSSNSNSNSSSDDSSSSDKKKKLGSKNTIEALFHKDSLMAQLFYTKQITENCALTSRLMWAFGTSDRIMSTVGYKYQFGRHQGMSKVICGEISSDGCIRQSLTFPLLTNMLVKFNAEMNHFLTSERMQRGEFPHKFGISLNIHL